ncbi:MAG: AI-2E family transporter [Bacteroidetes bacterium]|nr:AI-2E family transporter [Bacteroidota bacterium]
MKPYRTLFTILAAAAILWFGKPFLIPLAYAVLIAIVLIPVVRWLEGRKFGPTAAIVLPTLLVCTLFLALAALLTYEFSIISSNWSAIQQRIDPLIIDIHNQLESLFGWSAERQNQWLLQNLEQAGKNAGSIVKQATGAMLDAIFNLIIIPVYVVLILATRKKLVRFAIDISPAGWEDKMPAVLNDTVKVFSGFIRGMVLVYLIVGLLNSIGLWMIGVDNALVYGMITAIMTIIPVLGIMISAMLPVTLSWINTGTVWQPLGVVAVFSVVQYLEANLIFPYVVGRQVNLNTLAAILAITLGALIWGVAGMILFVPFLAVFKIFADHFPGMKPWSRLLEH